LVVTGDDNGSVLVWDSETGRAVTPPQQVFDGVVARVEGFVFRADGSRCLMYTANQSRVWNDFPRAKNLGTVCGKQCTVMSADGELGYSRFDANVHVFDLTRGKSRGKLPCEAVELCMHDNCLIAMDPGGGLTLWDCKKGRVLLRAQGPLEECHGMACTGRGIVLTWCNDRLSSFDVRARQWTGPISGTANVKVVGTGPVGKVVVLRYREGPEVREAPALRRLKVLDAGKVEYFDVAISGDERCALGVAGTCLDLWQLRGGKRLTRWPAKPLGERGQRDYISAAALSRDGRTIVAGTVRGRVMFLRWDGKALVPLS
jgi:hypothetical protein